MNSGFLLVRLLLGGYLAAHGVQKLFGWFGGHGLAGTGGFMETLGFRPGKLFALAAGLCEGLGGVLVVLGLLGPIGPALIIVAMVVAMGAVHLKNGFFAASNGVEMPLAWATCAVAVAFYPGRYSLDTALGLALNGAWVVRITIVVAVLIALGNLLLRKPEAPAKAA
ncbi:MAG TPA: DoxX family protein [Anaeromyxobacter sp.]|nr:DoxX family protein [Anaeromyxobacter sp.]